ncbi:MAG: hypothetical protein HYV09_18705 [Deltaproteobacteria bacterium]|nr:hypothetical protein [Deltaproteobacteria bacterium]
MHRTSFLAAAVATVFACSSDRAPQETSRRVTTSSQAALRALATIRAVAPLLPRTTAIAPLRADGARFVAPPFERTSAWEPAGARALQASVSTDGALRLSLRGLADVWVEVQPDARLAAPTSSEGAVVFAGGSEEIVYFAAREPRGGAVVEDLRVLRDDRASPGARWTITGGPAIADVRVRAGAIEIVDRDGYVRFQTEPVVAYDAAGVRRDATVAAERQGDRWALHAALDARGLAYPIVLDPAWKGVGAMSGPRYSHVMIRLLDGRVLSTGGYDGAFVLSTAEIFSPTTGTWSAAAPMLARRRHHALSLVTGGKVLMAGGSNAAGYLSSAELYDPATNTWTLRGATRWHSPATLTPAATGKLLLTGDGDLVASLHDPAAGTWTDAGTQMQSRSAEATVPLSGGRVLLIGGWSGGPPRSTAEIWNPATSTWALTDSMAATRQQMGSIVLSTGKVLVAGGWAGPQSTAELFDPVTSTWSVTGAMVYGRHDFQLAPLPGGKVLAAGGGNGGGGGNSIAEVYDTATAKWTSVSAMSALRRLPTVAALADGSVLVTGGSPAPGDLPSAIHSTAEVFALMPNGTACTLAADCLSGLCVDGVCCATTCTATCQACNLAGSAGTCTNVTGAPVGSRSCAPYATCAAGACATSCTGDASCVSTHYCVSGACVPRKPAGAGQACTAGRECVGGNCVDGYCCTAACAGQCEACNEPGKLGTCSAVTGAPRGTRTACAGVGVGTTCGHQCNGVNRTACQYPPADARCSVNGCTDGIETHASFCDGAGKCNDVPKSCGAYKCDAVGCKSVCTSKTDCVAGFTCTLGVCVALDGLGKDCTDASTCATGSCVDGVCCGTASCDAGSSCAVTGKKGTCTKLSGATCATGAECATGSCVDGVCCDSACDGQCQACDVPGSVGKCSPVSGEPHGTRAKCDSGGGDVCKALACDGSKDVIKCVGFVAGPTTECRASSCSGSTFVPAGVCGAGTCPAPEPKSCAPYACDAKGCLTTCAGNDQCAAGNVCKDAACVPGATCSDDGLSSVSKEGTTSCSPYRCGGDGRCPTTCVGSDQCAPGFVCDTGGRCVAAPTPTEDGGGCIAGRGTSGGGAAALLLALLAAARRRGATHRPRRLP